jgi:uncharacterized membrane protein
MNIHPIFVHFPIALLTVYAILELIRFKKITDQTWFEYVKGSFVIIGALSSSLALQTGELAEELYEKNNEVSNLIETHANWAGFASYLFAILAVLYAIHFVIKSPLHIKIQNTFVKPFWLFIVSISETLFKTVWFMMIASFVGIIAITITGALGGAIVYGPDVDPVVKIIYSLLVK